MAFPTSVNGQITDIVSSLGEEGKVEESTHALRHSEQGASSALADPAGPSSAALAPKDPAFEV